MFAKLRDIQKSAPFILVIVTILFTSAADAQNRDSKRYKKMYAQIFQFQKNPEKVDFLTIEALKAGVRKFEFTKSKSEYGRAKGNGTILLSTVLRGGTGVINVTHEIAHMAGFKRNCHQPNGGHNKCWIKIYLAIAKRYEERFPGETWSGTTPTKRVLRNLERYNIKM